MGTILMLRRGHERERISFVCLLGKERNDFMSFSSLCS